jgi:hypothetical protein
MNACIDSTLPKPVHRVPWRDRLRLFLQWIITTPTRRAVRHLSKVLQADNDYAITWHANIAMPIYDGAKGKLTPAEANEIADNLMRHLFQANAEYPPQVRPGCEFVRVMPGNPYAD